MWTLVTFLVGCSTLALAQDLRCLECICQVESDCGLRPVGCVMDRGSLSCGYYQIKEPYWIDCGRPGGGWKKCANDYVCARGCVKAYMKRYGHICTKSISPLTCEQVSRIHNGGPFGCRNDNTLPYWNKVAKCYNPKYGM